MNEYLKIVDPADRRPASLKVLLDGSIDEELGVLPIDSATVVEQFATEANCSPESVKRYLRGQGLRPYKGYWMTRDAKKNGLYPTEGVNLSKFNPDDIEKTRRRVGKTIFRRPSEVRKIG